MKKGILLAVVIFLSTAGFAQAQEGELSGTIDVTYVGKYLWRGFDLYGDKSAIQPSIDLDLYGTGLGLNVWYSRANASGFENGEEVDITLSYSSSLFDSETYATDYSVGWIYYAYPDQPRAGSTHGGRGDTNSDTQEFFVSLSWPEICPAGTVPSYTLIKAWTSESSSALSNDLSSAGGYGGYFHILGIGYDLPIEDLLPDLPEQILNLSVATVFNDGVNGADQDWSHIVFGASTDFDLGNDLTLTPGIYYQSSWEDTVNPSDEFWGPLGISYAF